MFRPLSYVFAAAMAMSAVPAMAEAVKYELDPSHSQIVFTYDHFGFSTTYSMFSGFTGDIMFDEADPAASSVSVTFPIEGLITGFQARFDHFMTADFFNAATNKDVTFVSTAIEVTGDTTAKITGDLTLNGVTKPVTLDTKLNYKGDHPMAQKPWLGLSATTTINRSEFNLGMFVPNVPDAVPVTIEIEAGKAE